jgi:SAM-dependent methyltransferase
MSSPAMWNERFGLPEYAYGKAPNVFVAEEAWRIPRGAVLCLAEGEGRNAVHLAALGHDVTAVDLSPAGLGKAEALARERGVSLTLVEADLAEYAIAPVRWQGIVAAFAHLPPELRARVHRAAVQGLVPGGVFLLVAYTPAQLALGTGGPRIPELLMSLDTLREELDGLDLVVARERQRDLHEGAHHVGPSALVEIVGVRRAR